MPLLEPGSVLVLDHASIHRGGAIRKLVAAAACSLLYLPPYSPDLNPVEPAWGFVKHHVRTLAPRDDVHSDKVWLLKGFVASEAGTLTLKDGRLTFTTDKPVLDSPLTAVEAVNFPWFYFGAGCALTINGVKYGLSFIQPGNTAGGEYPSIPEARRKGQR